MPAEGGQMPLLPPRCKGFSNYPFKRIFMLWLPLHARANYSDGEAVNKKNHNAKGLLRKGSLYVKVLGNRRYNQLTVDVDKISASAKEK